MYKEMLEASRALRLEHEREDELAQQRVEQKNTLLHTENKYRRTAEQLRELRAGRIQGGPEGGNNAARPDL